MKRWFASCVLWLAYRLNAPKIEMEVGSARYLLAELAVLRLRAGKVGLRSVVDTTTALHRHLKAHVDDFEVALARAAARHKAAEEVGHAPDGTGYPE